MFDNVGRDLDEEASRRRTTSLLITTAGGAAVMGLVAGIVYLTATTLIEPQQTLEIAMLDPIEEELPPLPALPPPPLKGSEASQARDTPPAPDTPPETAQELAPTVEQEIASAEQPQGTPDGDPSGDPDGVENGHIGGDPDGDPNGVPVGVRVFHHSELEVKRRVNPSYPEAARALAVGEQRCLAKVFIDEDGVPYDVEVAGCPQPFHPETRAAILNWRWYPPKDSRRRVRAQTTIAITYRLD